MKKVSNKEIIEIANNIINKTSESTNNYDAVEDVSHILRVVFSKMDIIVEDPTCNCEGCDCNK